MSGFLGTGSVSFFVGQPLSHDTRNCFNRALSVSYLQRPPLVISEIELRKITLQVLLAHMVIGAGDPPLEDGEVTLNSIRMSFAANVLTDPVIDDLMPEILVHVAVLACVIGHQECIGVQLCDQYLAQGLGGNLGNNLGPNTPTTLNQSEGNLLARAANVAPDPLLAVLVFLLAANVSFIGLNSFALAAKRTGRVQLAQSLPNAMRHKPRRLVRKAEHPVKVMGTHPLPLDGGGSGWGWKTPSDPN